MCVKRRREEVPREREGSTRTERSRLQRVAHNAGWIQVWCSLRLYLNIAQPTCFERKRDQRHVVQLASTYFEETKRGAHCDSNW